MSLAEMKFLPPNLSLAGAEIFVLVMACVILLTCVFVKSKTHALEYGLTQITLLGAVLLTFALNPFLSNFVLFGFFGVSDAGLTSFNQAMGFALPLKEIKQTFGQMFLSDTFGDFMKVLVCLIMMMVLCYSRGYTASRADVFKGEFYVLSLFVTLGMMVMTTANHFMTIYIGIELLSLSLYGLVAINRDSVASTEAAMKYFILGALASGLLLYGISMVYGATGSLDIRTVLERILLNKVDTEILGFASVFLVAGIAFKLGAAPFHMWIPDVYHGAPTPVTAMISSAPKLATFVVVIRIFVGDLFFYAADWQSMFLVLALVSMALGNFAAIAQTNIKRMLAYSAISHMGFMLLGLTAGIVGEDTRNALNAHSSAMFYMVTYALSSAGAFGVILLLARAGGEAEEISDFAGLNKRSPWLALMMMMILFSMAGIPFFVGFFSKFAVLQALIISGKFWFAIAAIFFSLVGAFYYLRVIKVMYFDPAHDNTPIPVCWDARIVMTVNSMLVALLGIFPDALLSASALVIMRAYGMFYSL